MKHGAEVSSPSDGHADTLQVVRELLDGGQYARVADLIRQAQASRARPPEALSSRVLSAANRICVACDQARADAERHQRDCLVARQRESEMLGELREMLELLSPARRARAEQAIAERAAIDSVERVATAAGSAGAIEVHCLGPFRVTLNGEAIESWSSCRSKAIFKYLVAHRERPVAKEVLMECFWPDASPDAARNNLNVAMHGLRKTLSGNDASISHVLFREGCYLINPELSVWVDAEAFKAHVSEAQALERRELVDMAIDAYRQAEVLYRGDFLEDDRYQEWPDPIRHELRECYRGLAYRLSEHHLQGNDVEACEAVCQKLLALDACDEASHRQLMRCYGRQGRLNLALRQFDICVEALQRELDVGPAGATVELRDRLRNRLPI